MKRETDKCMCGSSLASETASCSSLLANQKAAKMAFILQPKNEWSVQLFGISFVFFFLWILIHLLTEPFFEPLCCLLDSKYLLIALRNEIVVCIYYIFFSDDKVVNQTNIQFATLQMLLLFEKKKRIDIMMASPVFFHTRHLWQKNWWNLWGKMHFSCLEIH